jgi:hypothetical protein
LYDLFIRPLHQAGVRYMIVGSVASIHYGEPRLTLDVDLVVQLESTDIATVIAALPEPDYYTPPPEVIGLEIQRPDRGHFNAIHVATGFKADFYPIPRTPKTDWAWEKRRCFDINGHPAYFAPPEYVILSKLEFYREGGSDKHLRDIRGMLAVSGDQIDLGLIDQKAAELGLAPLWGQVCRK